MSALNEKPYRRGNEDAEFPQRKTTETVLAAAFLLTYLRLAGKSVRLPINFNTAHLRDGTRRVVNSLRTSASSAPLR